MIIKVLRFKHATSSAQGAKARADASNKAGAGLARYIVSREKPDLSDVEVSELVGGGTAGAAAVAVGSYTTNDTRLPGRVVSVEGSYLNGDDPQFWIDQMAEHAEAAGIDRLYHIIFSHRPDEPVTPEMMSRHRAIIRRVMNLADSPGLGAMHGDEDHDHYHEFDVAGPDGKFPKVGQGWVVEASHIAIAMCEHVSRLEPEPMRRYVADESGVYHFLTNTRVADTDGRILLDRKEMRTLQIDHDEIVAAAKLHGEQGHDLEWGDDMILENLVRPHISKSNSWEELHRSLARIGVRYECDGSTATVIFNRPGNDGVGYSPTGFYSRATPGKLRSRFNAHYEPPPPDLWVRPFVAPRYPQASADIDGKAERAAARESAKDLEAYRQRKTRAARKALNAANLGAAHNQISRELAEADALEKAAIAAVKRQATRKNKDAPSPAPQDQMGFDALPMGILWGDGPSADPADRSKRNTDEDDELERRYRLERRHRSVEYWRGQQLAFIAYQHTVVVHARDKGARLDALRLAERKFGVVKAFGNRAFQDDMIALAIEHGIKIDEKQKLDYLRRQDAELRRQQRAHFMEPLRTDERGKPVNFASMGRAGVAERNARDRRIAAFDHRALHWLRERNAIEDDDNKGPNPKRTSVGAVMRILNGMDRDTMLLASSRFNREGLRYLDDEALIKALGAKAHAAIRPEVQERLSAIARIHTARREWICSALASGQAQVVGEELTVTDQTADWAGSFFRAQKDDPVFKRMIQNAGRDLIDLSNVDRTIRPEVAAWREARATSASRGEIDAIATELFLATTTEQRDALFKKMIDSEAKEFRATKGVVFDAYRRTPYGRKEEKDRSWRARQRNAKRIYDGPSR